MNAALLRKWGGSGPSAITAGDVKGILPAAPAMAEAAAPRPAAVTKPKTFRTHQSRMGHQTTARSNQAVRTASPALQKPLNIDVQMLRSPTILAPSFRNLRDLGKRGRGGVRDRPRRRGRAGRWAGAPARRRCGGSRSRWRPARPRRGSPWRSARTQRGSGSWT